MSAPQLWAYVQGLFKSNVFYAVGDLLDKAMWAGIGAKFGKARYVLNFSNVIDYLLNGRQLGETFSAVGFEHTVEALKVNDRNAWRKAVIKDVVAALGDVIPDEGVSVLFTTGLQSPHGYERFNYKPKKN